RLGRIHERRPGRAAIEGPIDTALRGADVHDVGIYRVDDDGGHPAANRINPALRLAIRDGKRANRRRTSAVNCGTDSHIDWDTARFEQSRVRGCTARRIRRREQSLLNRLGGGYLL